MLPSSTADHAIIILGVLGKKEGREHVTMNDPIFSHVPGSVLDLSDPTGTSAVRSLEKVAVLWYLDKNDDSVDVVDLFTLYQVKLTYREAHTNRKVRIRNNIDIIWPIQSSSRYHPIPIFAFVSSRRHKKDNHSASSTTTADCSHTASDRTVGVLQSLQLQKIHDTTKMNDRDEENNVISEEEVAAVDDWLPVHLDHDAPVDLIHQAFTTAESKNDGGKSALHTTFKKHEVSAVSNPTQVVSGNPLIAREFSRRKGIKTK